MKKILVMAVAALFATTVFAQKENGRGGHRMMNDGVVSMAVIKQMNLDSMVVKSIMELSSKKRAELAEVMKLIASKKGADAKEKAANKADRNAFRNGEMPGQSEEMKAWKKSYRAGLRAILGDEAYIDYLERQADTPRMMMGGGQRNGNFGGQRPQGGFGGPRGGFGGFGGGFGDTM